MLQATRTLLAALPASVHSRPVRQSKFDSGASATSNHFGNAVHGVAALPPSLPGLSRQARSPAAIAMLSLLEGYASVTRNVAAGAIAALVGRYPPAHSIAKRAGLPIRAD